MVMPWSIVARPGALPPVDGEDRADRNLCRESGLGRHGAVDREGLGGEHPSAGVAPLTVGSRRDAEVRAGAAAPVLVGIPVIAGRAARLLVEPVPDAHDRGAQLLVDAVVLEGALLDVDDGAGEQQATGGEREDGHEQPRSQRGHHVRGWRSA
jgi:hypothetical protein